MHGVQAWNTKGTTFKINHILYVDDSMFVFDKKSDMIKGAEILRKHMARFGLLLHFGKDGKKSKTEAVYFPPPGVEEPKRTSQSSVLMMIRDT
jgi:nitrous oxidase accessory protein NosD